MSSEGAPERLPERTVHPQTYRHESLRGNAATRAARQIPEVFPEVFMEVASNIEVNMNR